MEEVPESGNRGGLEGRTCGVTSGDARPREIRREGERKKELALRNDNG